MSANGTMTVGEMLSQLRNTPIAMPGATSGDAVSGDDALAVWAKNYVNSGEGKRVSALIDVRLRALLDPLVTSMAQSTASFVHERIAEATPPLVARNAELEARVIELESHIIKLEQQPSPKYRGVWDAQTGYFAGDFITDHGSLWHCDKACTGVRPPESCWTLAVKSGRDAKGR